MRKMILVLMMTAMSATAQADERTDVLFFRRAASTNKHNLLEAVALNGAAATRTITLTLGDSNPGSAKGWSKLRVSVFYTYSAATTVTAQLSCSQDGTNYAILQTRNCSAGTCTLSDATDSKATGNADRQPMMEFDIRGCQKAKVVFGGAGAGAGDLVNVQAVAIAGE
jgi:hypothetical protein